MTNIDINNKIAIKVSSAWAKRLFACSEEYIRTTCKGDCCRTKFGCLHYPLLPREVDYFKSLGCTIKDHFLIGDKENNQCPLQVSDGLCILHGKPEKALWCVYNPFTINKNNTLILRHRYLRWKCHNHGDFAYRTFFSSLQRLFGNEEAQKIYDHFEISNDDIVAYMNVETYQDVRYLEANKFLTND